MEEQNIWKEQLIKENASRKQVTNDTPSQRTPPPAVVQQNYDWNSHLQTFDFENRHHTPGIQSPVQNMTTLTHSVYKKDLHIANEST